jgi:hypothetical protein
VECGEWITDSICGEGCEWDMVVWSRRPPDKVAEFDIVTTITEVTE